MNTAATHESADDEPAVDKDDRIDELTDVALGYRTGLYDVYLMLTRDSLRPEEQCQHCAKIGKAANSFLDRGDKVLGDVMAGKLEDAKVVCGACGRVGLEYIDGQGGMENAAKEHMTFTHEYVCPKCHRFTTVEELTTNKKWWYR